MSEFNLDPHEDFGRRDEAVVQSAEADLQASSLVRLSRADLDSLATLMALAQESVDHGELIDENLITAIEELSGKTSQQTVETVSALKQARHAHMLARMAIESSTDDFDINFSN